jgi:minor extracellular serine protease Vpr
MKSGSLRLVVGLAAALSLLVPATIAGAALNDVGTVTAATGAYDETATAWFVELRGAPTAKGGNRDALRAEHAAFKAAAKAEGVALTERYEYTGAWNGLSVRVARGQVARLAGVSGVKAIYPVVQATLPPATSGNADPDINNATGMTGANIARTELGLTGKGVTIAIMDSGLDYTLPEFGSCASVGRSCRVRAGWDFVGDDFDSNEADSTFNPVAVPDPDPAPCNPIVADQRAAQPGAGVSNAGHGTHVAGIAAADGRNITGGVTGVAPEASLVALKVFGCNGSTDSDIMAAAMERALELGADVLNMSIGAAFVTWPQYPTAVAADNLVDAGVVVVTSTGNSGANGLWSASAPGVAHKVIASAAVDNVIETLPAFRFGGKTYGYQRATAAPDPPLSGSNTLVVASPLNGCTPITNDVAGKVVLIQRGVCTFHVKAATAQAAGAAAVVLFNNVAGPINPTVAGPVPITIPVVAVTLAAGTEIQSGAPGTLTWTDQVVEQPLATGNTTSSFSSYGTTAELVLKPDVAAPGGQIFSTWPHQQFAGHNTIGGTSMASPHVAGSAALYLQAHPGATADTIRTALQNTARPIGFTGVPAALESTFRQGAGMIQVDKAITSATSVTPSKLSLGEGNGGSATVAVSNTGSSAVTYDITTVEGLDAFPIATQVYPFGFGLGFGVTHVTIDSLVLTVPAGGTASKTFTLTPDAGLPEKALYGGWVVLTPRGGGQVLRVPFAGFKGDYQSLPTLNAGGCNYPALVQFEAQADAPFACAGLTTFERRDSGATYTMEGNDVPAVLYHLNHPTRWLRIEVLNADGSRVHPVFSEAQPLQEFLPRNSTNASFFAFTWDGMRSHDQGNGNGDHRRALPNGRYVLRFTALKALGDPNTPGHTETWTSPVITLAR